MLCHFFPGVISIDLESSQKRFNVLTEDILVKSNFHYLKVDLTNNVKING